MQFTIDNKKVYYSILKKRQNLSISRTNNVLLKIYKLKTCDLSFSMKTVLRTADYTHIIHILKKL